MPEFSNPFAGVANAKKLSKDELVRAIRFNVAAEFEAIQMYTQLADSIDDSLVQAVLRDIAEEETVHAGELLRLVKHLAPNEENLYKKGYTEVEEQMEKLKIKK
jgi:rubrerythrin